jgi:hypothetical protein
MLPRALYMVFDELAAAHRHGSRARTCNGSRPDLKHRTHAVNYHNWATNAPVKRSLIAYDH